MQSYSLHSVSETNAVPIKRGMFVGDRRDGNVFQADTANADARTVQGKDRALQLLDRAYRFILEPSDASAGDRGVRIRDLRHGMLLADTGASRVGLVEGASPAAVWLLFRAPASPSAQGAQGYFLCNRSTGRYLAASYQFDGNVYMLASSEPPTYPPSIFTWYFVAEPAPEKFDGFVTADDRWDMQSWMPRVSSEDQVVPIYVASVPDFFNADVSTANQVRGIDAIIDIWNSALSDIGAQTRFKQVFDKSRWKIKISVGDTGVGAAAQTHMAQAESHADRAGSAEIVFGQAPHWWVWSWDGNILRQAVMGESFFGALTHELGHCLGLGHSEFNSSIMHHIYRSVDGQLAVRPGLLGDKVGLTEYDRSQLKTRHRVSASPEACVFQGAPADLRLAQPA